MHNSDQIIQSLREAVHHSPENGPLRQHLAEILMSVGRFKEAETEYRAALALKPEDTNLKLGLARAFAGQPGKTSHALVLLEALTGGDDPQPEALASLARVLTRIGDLEPARQRYRQAIAQDPSLTDDELAGRLGMRDDDLDEATSDDPDESGLAEFDSTDPSANEGHHGLDRSGNPRHGDPAEIERPRIDFDDVGGMESLKDEIRLKIIAPMTHPEMYRAYGKTIGGGILMYGPPGCGKTHLARATAGQIQAKFLSVGIHEVLDLWVGRSEKNLHAIFEQARRHAPCVLFFDEVDALAASRQDMKSSAGRHVINQFLAETDGLDASNEGVLLLAATNAPWHVDSAFRRPGRFDRILFVPPPDEAARIAILRILCQDKPQQDLDIEHVARKAREFSGADLKAVLDVAIEAKLRDALRTGTPEPLATKDLIRALNRVNPSTREWFTTARNYALYANQGGAYDAILDYLKSAK